jgi:hypothetical protein
MTYSMVDYADVQGLVRFGYGRMTSASYALVRVKNVAAAKAWLRAAPVTNAVEQSPPPTTALQIAFTAPGLKELGLPHSVIEGFSREFRTGMSKKFRARLLGDVGRNARKHWDWGGPGSEAHLLVMFFAEPEHFDSFVQSTKGNTWSDAFEEVIWLGTSNLDGDEPFGFADGISQPQIDWEQQLERPHTELEYTNVVALGEFLLGYRNEYGKFTDRPLLDPDAANAELLSAVDAPAKKDLGRNGTYLVMRQLEQDVREFWKFLFEQVGGNLAEIMDTVSATIREREEIRRSIGVLTTRRGSINLHKYFAEYLRTLGIDRPLREERHGYLIPLQSAARHFVTMSKSPHTLFVGDALGVADPVTAEGITYAILSGQLAARAGARLNDAKDGAQVQQSLVAQAKDLRRQYSGVSLDEEATILIQFQRAYQANSRFITVLDQLTQETINLIK